MSQLPARYAKRKRAKAHTLPAVIPEKVLNGQRERYLTFCREYLANGFNATRAYLKAHPHVAMSTANTEGPKLLGDPRIRAILKPALDKHWKHLQMDGEEALARVSQDARADIALLYNEDGTLKHPTEWPASIRGSVRSIQDGPYGLKVSLVDPLAARKLILEQTGKLRTTGESLDNLAAAIRGDLGRQPG